MKVKCKSCGKRFDHDEYMGICPKCTSFYSPETYIADKNRSNANRPDMETSDIKTVAKKNDFRTISDNATESIRNNKKITIVLLIVVVLTAVLPITIAYIHNETNYKARTQASYSVIPIQQNETIVCPYEELHFQITITDAVVDNNPAYNLPTGYEILQVNYTVDLPENETQYYYKDSNRIPGIISADIFLCTMENHYVTAIRDYDMAELLGYDYKQLETAGISNGFDFLQGSIYFLVKKEDAKGLWIQTYKDDVVTQTYEMEELEVTR